MNTKSKKIWVVIKINQMYAQLTLTGHTAKLCSNGVICNVFKLYTCSCRFSTKYYGRSKKESL